MVEKNALFDLQVERERNAALMTGRRANPVQNMLPSPEFNPKTALAQDIAQEIQFQENLERSVMEQTLSSED